MSGDRPESTQQRRQRDANRTIRHAATHLEQHDAGNTEDDVRQPGGEPGREYVSLRERLPKPQQDVIDEHDRDADDEARQLAIAAVGRAKRQADQAEHEARGGNRELLVNLEELIVRELSLFAYLLGTGPQFGDRHFTVALGRAALRKHRVRAETEAGSA